jgi:hypothetical protein
MGRSGLLEIRRIVLIFRKRPSAWIVGVGNAWSLCLVGRHVQGVMVTIVASLVGDLVLKVEMKWQEMYRVKIGVACRVSIELRLKRTFSSVL